MARKPCIICDIDGVYTDSREWGKYIPKEARDRKGWDNFATHINLCKPNKTFIQILKVLNKIFPILFVTSRERTPMIEKETIKQIETFSNNKILVQEPSKNKVLMRDVDDYRNAEEVKEETLNIKVLPFYIPILAIDDEKKNIDLFRSKGIPSLWYTKFKR